jgi:hypothetical protein
MEGSLNMSNEVSGELGGNERPSKCYGLGYESERWDISPLNEKQYKFEDGKMYVKVDRRPSEPIYVNFSDILTKKDVLKLIDILGTYMTLMFQHKGDISYENLEHFTEELVELRKELKK